MHVLLTGHAGFIGSHLLEALLADGHHVTAVDNYDPFYSRSVKEANLAAVKALHAPRYHPLEADLAAAETLKTLTHAIAGGPPLDAIIHLAAKAGVRPSIADPVGYQRANVIATQNLLEFARMHAIRQFVFASSSSVYGINPNVPWREDDTVLKPISPYASTKVSCELLGHTYSHLFGIRFLALRFFTVYGPRQRPDLAIHKFVEHIRAGRSIPVFGDGSTRRDYTYVADIVSGILAALEYSASPYEIINLGNNHTVSLAEMIATLEDALSTQAIIDRQPDQLGDVPQTWANIEKAKKLLGYNPQTAFADGIRSFINWKTKI